MFLDRGRWVVAVCGALVVGGICPSPVHAGLDDLQIERIVKEKKLPETGAEALRKQLKHSKSIAIGAGPTKWQISEERCESEVLSKGLLEGGESDRKTCGHPNMALLPSSDGSKGVCVDRFEWPNLPCRYPATWATAREAAEICSAEGKRLCDAGEWEGACSGEAQPSDWVRGRSNERKIVWAYGNERRGDLCGFGSSKSEGCDRALAGSGSVTSSCGANAWPAGSFPACKSSIGVYDQHGNVAEHMNLARSPSESTANGGSGVTEMKGSWFVFPRTANANIHKDDCLWREPGWHRTEVMSGGSHANYHLGFRCCKTAD